MSVPSPSKRLCCERIADSGSSANEQQGLISQLKTQEIVDHRPPLSPVLAGRSLNPSCLMTFDPSPPSPFLLCLVVRTNDIKSTHFSVNTAVLLWPCVPRSALTTGRGGYCWNKKADCSAECRHTAAVGTAMLCQFTHTQSSPWEAGCRTRQQEQ